MEPLKPFWSDDFDMDLLKVVPDTRQLLDASGDVVLFTHGHTTHDRLNHPSVWNSHKGAIAFFGFSDPAKPHGYSTDLPVVRCTFLELMRDVWSHNYLALIEGRPVIDGIATWQHFEPLMYHLRSWHRLTESAAEKHLAWTRRWIERSRDAFLDAEITHLHLLTAPTI